MTKLLLPTHTTYRESISAVTRTGWFHIRVIERKRIGSDRRRRDGCRGPVTCNGADREQGPIVIIAESGCRNKDRGIAASIGKSSALAVPLFHPFGIDLALIAQRFPLLNGRYAPSLRTGIGHIQPCRGRTTCIIPLGTDRIRDHRYRPAPSDLLPPLIQHSDLIGPTGERTRFIDIRRSPTNTVDKDSTIGILDILGILSIGARHENHRTKQNQQTPHKASN